MVWSSDETGTCTLMHLKLLQETGLSAEQLLMWLKKIKKQQYSSVSSSTEL